MIRSETNANVSVNDKTSVRGEGAVREIVEEVCSGLTKTGRGALPEARDDHVVVRDVLHQEQRVAVALALVTHEVGDRGLECMYEARVVSVATHRGEACEYLCTIAEPRAGVAKEVGACDRATRVHVEVQVYVPSANEFREVAVTHAQVHPEVGLRAAAQEVGGQVQGRRRAAYDFSRVRGQWWHGSP